MLKRSWKHREVNQELYDVVNRTLSDLEDDKNYIHLLMISALDSEEKELVENRGTIKSIITNIVEESGNKFKKNSSIKYDEETTKIIYEAFSISQAISNSPSFVEYVGNMTRENPIYNKLKDELIAVGEEVAIQTYSMFGEDVKKCGRAYFLVTYSTIVLEYYDILKKADIISIISRYNNKEEVGDDVELKIIYPFFKVLAMLIDEQKEMESFKIITDL